MFGVQRYSVDNVVYDCTLATAYLHKEECQLSSVASFFIAAESQCFVFGIIELVTCILLFGVMSIVVIWPFISQYVMNYIPISIFNFFETTNWSRMYKKEDETITDSLLSNVTVYHV